MNKEDKLKLLEELKEKFEKAKSEIGFKSNFDEVEKAFYLKDAVLTAGFVSERFPRQLRARIVDNYKVWMSFLHNLLLPNAQNIISLNESKVFTSEEKNEIGNVLGKMMQIITRNDLINLEENKKLEAELIDEAVNRWNGEFNPYLVDVMKKIDERWK